MAGRRHKIRRELKTRVEYLVDRLPLAGSSIGNAAELSALCQSHPAPASDP
jgi:hypothetical protein